jgi:hypothetical protein
MVGLNINGVKVPYISLDNFINKDMFAAAKTELLASTDTEFIGYNGEWLNQEFQAMQAAAFPITTAFIATFHTDQFSYNIRLEDSTRNVLLHQDISPFPCAPWDDLIPNYKASLKDSINALKISDSNGLRLDHDAWLKNEYPDTYEYEIKGSYKLHIVISDTKSFFIYDNVDDTIYDVTSSVSVFNARDFHDTRYQSSGISIQFPMSPSQLTNEIKSYLEIQRNNPIFI